MFGFLARLFGLSGADSVHARVADAVRRERETYRGAPTPRYAVEEDDFASVSYGMPQGRPKKAVARRGAPRPDGAWKILGRAAVAGAHHRKPECIAFVQAAERAPGVARIDLVREPGNPHDAKAVAVFGEAGGLRRQLGYLPGATAAEIARAPADMPLAGTLGYAHVTEDDFVVIEIDVLIPAQRAAYWIGKDNPFRAARAAHKPD